MKPRLILLGEPYNVRHHLAKKLSDFFGVPMFTADDLVDKDYDSNEFAFKLALINACNDGFVLCGIPTSKKHLMCLDDIDLCMFFSPDLEKTIKYNAHRRWCPTCFRTYHLIDKPPLHGNCDRCDSELQSLPGDDPKKIREALYEWNKLFHPILSHYKEDKKLLEIKKDLKDIDKISSKILKILNKEIEPSKNSKPFSATYTV